MCSWCYGFRPVLNTLTQKLAEQIKIKYLLGGLAADSELPMSKTMQSNIKSNWQQIEKTIPNIKFNYEFWKICKPRRSTYAACRAVIAAKKQNIKFEIKMIEAIQNAYYLYAKNPSDYNILYDISEEVGLIKEQFISDIHSDNVNNDLINQIQHSRSIGANSFPSLFLSVNQNYIPIVLDYNNADIIFEHISSYIHNGK